jgi:hypothetical protein
MFEVRYMKAGRRGVIANKEVTAVVLYLCPRAVLT